MNPCAAVIPVRYLTNILHYFSIFHPAILGYEWCVMHHASFSADRQRTIGEDRPSRVIRQRGHIPLGVFSYPFATMCLVDIAEPVSPGWCRVSLRCPEHGSS